MFSGYKDDRDVAFCAFVEDGDFAHIDRLMDRWGLKRIPHTPEGRVAVYKAVQECVGIGDEVKRMAREKCVQLGFSPYMRR